MSEVKPVYQAKMTFESLFCEVSEDDYKRLCGSDTIQTRILYPAETVESFKSDRKQLRSIIFDVFNCDEFLGMPAELKEKISAIVNGDTL